MLSARRIGTIARSLLGNEPVRTPPDPNDPANRPKQPSRRRKRGPKSVPAVTKQPQQRGEQALAFERAVAIRHLRTKLGRVPTGREIAAVMHEPPAGVVGRRLARERRHAAAVEEMTERHEQDVSAAQAVYADRAERLRKIKAERLAAGLPPLSPRELAAAAGLVA